MPPITLAEYQSWLLEQIDLLGDWEKPRPFLATPDMPTDPVQKEEWIRKWLDPERDTLQGANNGDDEEELLEWSGPNPNVFEDAADMVREAGEIALTLGRPDLYKATRVGSPMLAVPTAKELLGRCLAACDEMPVGVVAAAPPPADLPTPAALMQPEMVSSQTALAAHTKPAKLPLSCVRAFQQYMRAVGTWGEMTDRAAYDWLDKEDEETDDLPDFDTWARYLRAARKHCGRQKNTPRGGRAGRSIARADQVEYQRKNEDANDD